uniref:Lectizyme n=1 Tax=Zeugodacus cucurbitae TaxID=28588 RepID=A0A0A1XPP8_ZEUCU
MKYCLLGLLLVGAVYAKPNTSVYEDLPAAKNFLPESRIVGGELAPKSLATSYLVSLSASSVAYAHVCAGAIIAKEWVLTAAHCLKELGNSTAEIVGLPVYAGLKDRSNVENAQVRNIDFAFTHKQFDASHEDSPDLALLHVSPGFHFSANVSAVFLPHRNEVYANKIGVTYGWGLTNPEATTYVQELQVARSEVLSKAQCSEQLPADAPLGANQICAKTSACLGDGGSPLVHETKGGSELVGITSWGYLPCGVNDRPTVYTEVSRFIKWIVDVQSAYYILH